jgi:hypothetical protein
VANPEHLRVVVEGREAVEAYQRQNPGVHLDLRGAAVPFLGSLQMAEADLSESTIVGTGESDFNEANLRSARLGGTYDSTFNNADLTGANLQFELYIWTDFRDALLRDVDFAFSALVGCGLERADLTGAKFEWTTLADTDLSGCRGLGQLADIREVKVDIRTLELTLRGLGGQFDPETRAFFAATDIPEALLDYLPGLVLDRPVALYSCMISSAPEDEEFATRLYTDLMARHIRCWKYRESAVRGRAAWANIDRAVASYDKVILVGSEASLQRAGVLREIERALQKEDDLLRRRRTVPSIDPDVLIPLRLDDYLLNDWGHERAADVRAKDVADFRDWRNQERYEAELERLIRALSPSVWNA